MRTREISEIISGFNRAVWLRGWASKGFGAIVISVDEA
jgi:hypothetical protein